MKTLELLKNTRKLLSSPSKWTKGYFAKNEKGQDVDELSKSATCFCLLGALQHESHALIKTTYSNEFYKARELIETILVRKGIAPFIPTFNDNKKTEHSDILTLLDEAISEFKED